MNYLAISRVCDISLCTGCGACTNVCPKGAINMISKINRGLIPFIDEKKCISCLMCVNTCPINNKPSGSNISCFSAWSKNVEWQTKCASGGISSTIGEIIINNGGVVFGTCYENGVLKFLSAETLEKLKEFSGSKYVHSYTEGAYKKAKLFLENGRQVLFVATPCQIAGLRNYLRKDYRNLILIDILCHGVMPQEYLKDYLDNNYDKVIFKGEHGSAIFSTKDENITYKKIKEQDLLFMAYAKGLLHRENCYFCQYANLERMGDITVGDFWGYEKKKDEIIEVIPNRVSLVLCNTKKGQDIINLTSYNIEYHKRNISEALPFNKQLSQPCQKHKERDEFLQRYNGQKIRKQLKKTEFRRIVRKNKIQYLAYSILKKTAGLIKI